MHVSEYEVETKFIDRLESIGYEYIDLNYYDDVIDNFRSQLIKFNEKKIKEAKGTATLSDAEFSRVLIHLDDQTVDEYNSFEKDCVDNSDSTAVLVKQFQETNRKLIVTTIQKMAKAVNSKRYENLMDEYHDKKVVFIIDECHRSQFGRISKNPLKSASGFAIIPVFRSENPKMVLNQKICN